MLKIIEIQNFRQKTSNIFSNKKLFSPKFHVKKFKLQTKTFVKKF